MRFLAAAVTTLLALSAGALAQEPAAPATTPSPAPWTSEISVNGFASIAWTHSFDSPSSRQTTLRVFDFDEDSVKLDVFELVVQKAASAPRDAGFRVDLAAGASIPRVTASRGLFRDPVTGRGEDVDVQQAFVTWVAPVGKGLKMDAGKFVTHTGMEVIEGYDGWNDNYSRSILFGYAIPFTHTGLRAGYTFSDKVSALGMIVNGWDNVQDNNGGKTFGAQLALTPVKPLTVYLNYLDGPERDDDSDDTRRLFDVVAILKPTSRLTLGANWDHGTDKNVLPGIDAEWSGIAGYARLNVAGPFALAARAERFSDPDGVRTGVSQKLWELTLTPEYRLTPHLLARGELRFDHSDADVFEKGDLLRDRQTTAAVNVLYSF
jgi:hypothetical protein